MSYKPLLRACLIGLLCTVFSHQTALAHESITVGDYEIVVGWLEEPPIAGQMNALAVMVSDISSGSPLPVQDVSSLEITVSYGGQSKVLILQPLDEDAPGQFVAPILPAVPGEYTILLGGKLGTTEVESVVHPEEVQPEDPLQFPRLESSEQTASSERTDWLTWLAVLLGLAGVGLGASAHRKAR